MTWLYNIADIELGEPTQSGHEVYIDAVYYPPDRKKAPSKVIFKKNKHGKQKFSRLEVAFSQLARSFLAKGTTAHQKLVIDDSLKVVGLVTEHLCYVIEEKEGLERTFFTFDNPAINCNLKAKHISNVEQIPYYFFDKLPQGYFTQLLQAEKDNQLSIDYESLASILASSYTLEEDDLHKGNFGFYLVEKDGKPRVVFFKIDHDLMYADSIMSFNTSRPFHWVHGGNAFDITAEDLLNFPSLTDSTNSYWPTKFGYIANPWGNKEYHSFAEVDAFANLKGVPAFKKAKWMSFYKHILIPPNHIEFALKECLDVNNAHDRAQISLITEATIARQARLKAVLFSIKEFREFVGGLTKEDQDTLIREITESSPQLNSSVQLEKTMSSYKEMCRSNLGFEQGDTPLHTAIKLGDYRYEESIQMFGHFINIKNEAGKTPLDIAMELSKTEVRPSKDIRKNNCFIMKHLLENGADHSDASYRYSQDKKIESYKFKTTYLTLVTQAKSYLQFKDILRDIGEDHRYCLKFKKELAIECISQFIKVNQNQPNLQSVLIRLKKEMNGEGTKAECASIKYIRQLRSRLWIIRQIRGLYGTSSSLIEINDMVDKELANIKSKEPNSYSFFNTQKANNTPDAAPQNDDAGLQPT